MQIALGERLSSLGVTLTPVLCLHAKQGWSDKSLREVRSVADRGLAKLLAALIKSWAKARLSQSPASWTDCFLRPGGANRPGVQVTPARSHAIGPSRFGPSYLAAPPTDLAGRRRRGPRRNHGVRERHREQISPRAQQHAGVDRGRLRTACRAALSPSKPSHRSKPWRASLLREASHSLPSVRIRLCTMLKCPANVSRRLSLEGERCGIQLAGGR